MVTGGFGIKGGKQPLRCDKTKCLNPLVPRGEEERGETNCLCFKDTMQSIKTLCTNGNIRQYLQTDHRFHRHLYGLRLTHPPSPSPIYLAPPHMDIPAASRMQRQRLLIPAPTCELHHRVVGNGSCSARLPLPFSHTHTYGQATMTDVKCQALYSTKH